MIGEVAEDTQARYRRALAAHGEGLSNLARALYRQVLVVEPGNAPALHLLGLVTAQGLDASTAVDLISRSLWIDPDNSDARNNRGIALALVNRLDEALASYDHAIRLRPDYAEAHSNRGTVLKDLGRIDEALASYESALRLKPDYANAHGNLGNALRQLGRLNEACIAYEEAIRLKPCHAEVLNNYGITLHALKRPEAALAAYEQALRLKPDYADALCNLGFTLQSLGRSVEALANYKLAREARPGDAYIQHIIASLTGETTERAPPEYVRRVFDGYSDTFDAHLEQSLQYNVPRDLTKLVRRHRDLSFGQLRVLDLGCGTGLVGREIATDARELVGVDIAAGMIAKARARALYTRLVQADVTEMMRTEADASYDLIVCADVFIYLGRIEDVAVEAKRLLSRGGLFAFSIEALSTEVDGTVPSFRLEGTGRYSHSLGYLSRLAIANGFRVVDTVKTSIRVEGGKPVDGFLVLWGT